jgi:hypothetical protein
VGVWVPLLIDKGPSTISQFVDYAVALGLGQGRGTYICMIAYNNSIPLYLTQEESRKEAGRTHLFEKPSIHSHTYVLRSSALAHPLSEHRKSRMRVQTNTKQRAHFPHRNITNK